MSAVDRLAATLAKHRLQIAPGGYTNCACGLLVDEKGAWEAHLAAVIAGVDDLAVIELPKPNEREDGDTATTFGETYGELRVGVHDEYADQVQVWVDYEPIEPWSPREAVEFASYLLAVAKAAEAVSDR